MYDTTSTQTVNLVVQGGDIIRKIILKLIVFIFRKLHKKKQPHIKAVKSTVIILNINKD